MAPTSTSSAQRALGVLLLLIALIGVACQSDVDSVVVTPDRVNMTPAFAINGNGSVTLAWVRMPQLDLKLARTPSSTPLGPLAAIEVHRSFEAGFQPYSGTLYASLDPSTDHFVDTALTNGTTYYYRIVPVGSSRIGTRAYGNATDILIGRPYDYDAITTIDYNEHIQRIFTSGCAVSGCHVGTGGTHIVPVNAQGGSGTQFSLRSWEDLMAGGEHGAVIVPYKALKSHLLFHLNTDTLVAPVTTPHMPLPGFTIPENQFRTLFRWVNAGAYNEVGSVALSAYPKGKVLVTNQAEDLVCILDVATSLVSRYIQAGAANVFTEPPQAPHNITVDKPHGVYYVNLVGAGKVIKFSLRDNAILGVVEGISSPTQVALSPGGDTGYVAQFLPGKNAVRLFNTRTMTLLDSISSLNFDRPHGVEITPDGKELWVTGNSTDNILVADLATQTTDLIQLNNQPPGEGFQLLPYQTVMTSDNRFVYVSCQQSGEVRVIDRSTKSVVKVIPVGQWPLILAISPDNRFVYSANRNSNDVSVIRTADNTVVATIPNVGPSPHGIDVTADGRFAYVSCENVIDLVPPHHPTVGSKRPGFVSIIDLTNYTVVRQVEVGAFASGVAVVE